MKTLEEVRDIFEKDRFATVNGAVIDEVGEGYARCSMDITETHKNAMGAVMGGATFTLADFTFAVASNWQKMGTVALSSNVTFLGVAKGERLIAEAKVVKDGRSTCYYNVEITDELGTQVAVVTVSGFKKQ